MIGVEKDTLRIIVEIKTFLSPSDVHDLKVAIGQYNLYRDILTETQVEHPLYLAIPKRAFNGIFADPLGQLIIAKQRLKLLVFDEFERRLILWQPDPIMLTSSAA